MDKVRGEHLHATQAEGDVALCGALHEAQDGEREEQRASVGEHVRRVGKERERVGEDAGHDLAGHERDDQSEAGGQAPRVEAPRRSFEDLRIS